MRLQLLHFHVVFKTWPTFQELTSIVSFRRRRWSQRNFSENRNIPGNQSKDMLNSKIRIIIFLASRCWRCRPRLFKFLMETSVMLLFSNETKPGLLPLLVQKDCFDLYCGLFSCGSLNKQTNNKILG